MLAENEQRPAAEALCLANQRPSLSVRLPGIKSWLVRAPPSSILGPSQGLHLHRTAKSICRIAVSLENRAVPGIGRLCQ